MKNYINKKKIYSVTTMTPHRISFAGGGTDYPKYYLKNGGSVINSTINKYLFVTVKAHGEIFSEKYRLMYSQTEFCNTISEIKNNIARECLKLVPVDPPITISTISDLPPESGTGSSSCFTVGLLNALHAFRGERVSPGQLALEACKIEITKLKKFSGKQDQYASAYGGINKFIFSKNGEVKILPISISSKNINNLFSSIRLLWTDLQRDSSKVAKSYKFSSQSNIQKKIHVETVDEFQKLIEKKKLNYGLLSKVIKKTWDAKKKFSKSISPIYINNISDKLNKINIQGHRLVGAGAGGFFLCFLKNKRNILKLKNTFKKNKIIQVEYEPQGSRVISLINN
ncbi:hypothetical protein N9B95_06510 [Candidatus Pelagibacter sp.]|jgi:D-glycero-alpha-D-manno-heptose-7-phosphate kinase|nr:hypothetical protein [Candidatus Pelagibacter sp.]